MGLNKDELANGKTAPTLYVPQLINNTASSSVKYDDSYLPVDIEQNHPFPKTVFIDSLTTTKDGEQDKEAIARIETLRGMRFKPHQEYANQIVSDRQHNLNPNRTHDIHNGARFLRPINGFPLTFSQADFKSETIRVVKHTWGQKFLRWATILFSGPVGWIRAAAKSTLIEEGEFGFAKDIDGNIEIYNSGKGYQTGLSFATSITKAKIDSDYVNMFDRVHMIKVRSGEYAVGDLNGHPVILPPGRHLIESPQFTLKTKTDGKPDYFNQTDYVIKHGNTHIIRVPEGKVARAKLGSRIVILEPEYSAYDKKFGTGLGAYVVHDKDFELLEAPTQNVQNRPANAPKEYFHNISEPLVNLDPARVLTVPQTNAAVVEHNGNKIFLRGGRYALPDATYVYKNAMYDLTDRLVTISTANDTPLMSNDKIRLQIEAQLLFTVVDVEACELKVGIQDHIENTKQRARNKLYELVSKGNYLQPVSGKNQPNNPAASSSSAVTVYNEDFARRQITADFANQVYQELSKELDASSGIRLEKVLITSLIIQDPNVRQQVESEATQAASANAALSAAKISQETAVINAETAKKKELIDASKEAEKLLIQTQSKSNAAIVEGNASNQINTNKAQAEAANTLTLAQAKAKSIVTMAEADKTADTLRAEGLRQYDNIKPENLGYNQAMVTATGNATRDLLKGANLNLISNDAKNVGSMLLNSVAGTLFTGRASTRPNLEAEVVYPSQIRPSQTVS
jgi:hypothetical protein